MTGLRASDQQRLAFVVLTELLLLSIASVFVCPVWGQVDAGSVFKTALFARVAISLVVVFDG